MPPKQPLAPYVSARVPGAGAHATRLTAIPGVRIQGEVLSIPHHALILAEKAITEAGLAVSSARWAKPMPRTVEWEEVEAHLRTGGEVREFVLDGFLIGYQKAALSFSFARDGVHFWHPTGCLSGDTRVAINRAGKGFTLTVRELYQRQEGATFRGKKWNPDIVTHAQSDVEGFVRLNTLLGVVETGKQEVFEVRTTGGRSIKATASHMMSTRQGYVPLSSLRAGERVRVRGGQGETARERTGKSAYAQTGVRHHPHAVEVRQTRSPEWCRQHRFKEGYVEVAYRVATHRLVAEARENGMDFDTFVERCRTGNTEGLRFLDPKVYAVHHINMDFRDNRSENLEVVTHHDHATTHGYEGGWQNVAFPIVEDTVESITSVGVEDTYDLNMLAPHNNFVANEFVVHNSGKTLTGLLYGLCAPGPIVIVTRAASRLQYGREVERFTHIRPHVVRPASQRKKKEKGQTLAEYLDTVQGRAVIVVGWEALQDNLDLLVAARPGTVIFDESHRGKSSKRWEPVPLPETDDPSVVLAQEGEARRRGGFITDGDGGRLMMVPVENTASAAARLARAARRRVCTTATPIKDRVRDLWAQLDLAEPDAWGNATCWMDRYTARKPGTYGGFDTTGSSNLDELAERLAACVHRIDYAETTRTLPPKRRQSVYVSVEDQVKPSGGFQKELNDAAKRGASALIEVKLAMAASKKRKAVLGLVEDHLHSGHKVVLFTGRRRDCEELGKAFKDTKAKVWASHGGDSTQRRQEVVDEYMSHPGPCLLVGTGDAFGESINLQDTDAALFVMLPWTPGQVRQWEGRFVRHGMKRPVVIYYVVAEETVDEQVADKLISKLPAVEAVAKDEELAAARAFIAGTDDEEALAESIIAKLMASEGEKEDDE